MTTEKVKRGTSDPQIEAILDRIRTARNFDFRNYKRATLSRRIERRRHDRHCKTMADYAALLEREPAEFDALISSMLIKMTSFFRDQEMWDRLSRKVIPQMLAEKKHGEELRVWCAGCATGEEAFSVAILLAEAMGPAFHNQDVKVFGTDVDEKAISFARHGIYSREQVEAVPGPMLKRWFVEEPGGYEVRKELRRSVVFGINNLVSDAPISRLDLLLCRNVFIYLDAPLQKRVLTRFHYALRRHGVLVLGKSELMPFAARLFESVDLQRRIYRKDGRDAAAAQERLLSLLEREPLAREMAEGRAELGALELFHREVVQSMKLPLIGTALDGTILLWNAAAARFWGRSENDVTGKKLSALNLPGLSGELLIEKTALVREGKSQLERGSGSLPHSGNQSPVHLSVEVVPLRDAARDATGLLYVVHDVTAFEEIEEELRQANQERLGANEELQTINEELQSANEELETTNEELQSANEELQTTNEELQSTNEELETTNEELQSTNAELDATNRELAHRTEEMNSLAFINRATIRTVSAAVVVLDASGRIKMWNLAAERLMGIGEDEALGQLLWNMQLPGLGKTVLQRLRKSLQQKAPMRVAELGYELPNGSQGQAAVNSVPILDDGNVLGAVIIIEDITRLSTLSAELATLKDGNGRRARQS